MADKSSIKFDHREIAVIFSLFIFVSLLMFTVGILVGKGLAQAKLEAKHGGTEETVASHDAHGENTHQAQGTSITTGDEEEHGHGEHAESHADAHDKNDAHHSKDEHAKADPHEKDVHGKKEKHADVKHGEKTAASHSDFVDDGEDAHGTKDAHAELEDSHTDLELVPKRPKNPDAGLEDYPQTKHTESMMKDPRMAGLFEGSNKAARRETASVSKTLPKSFPKGKYTVQVGSYPNQREATERVEALKKLGFPYAYLSAKEISEKNTWYRVWLGYFPNEESAKTSGEMLQSRGEVNSYLVRKNETNG